MNRAQCVCSPCKNFGSCTVMETSTGTYVPSCMCMTGTSGTYCENSLCSGITCSSRGTCKLIDFGGGHTCVCENNYHGQNCERGGPCSVNPCLNGGSCTAISGYNVYCVCPEGYTGNRCQTGPCSSGWIHGGGNHCYIISTVATLGSLVGNVCARLGAWPAVLTDKAESLIVASSLCSDSSWSRFGNKGHLVIHDLLSWSSASKKCRHLGGTGLVHITTPAENTAVKALSSCDVWIGSHESKPNGGYTWDVEYLNWAFGKPDDGACVALLVGGDESAINRISDVSCDENIHFVCYKGTET
ncbi:uncharacterized protein LOC141910059 isoform X2 [Tubulanus polymorphus]|uniref:uncharacterized protein LOC141910059 isoform X2 n=1 Tax=Tubulanus polymorphus TaxID=672921 RepID=UPI003DA60F40